MTARSRTAGRPQPRWADVIRLAILVAFPVISLFLPGFISDALGLILLLPPVRGLLQAATAAWFVRRFTSVTGPGGVRMWTRPDRVVPGNVIRGDVVRDDVVRDDEPREGGSQPPQLPS